LFEGNGRQITRNSTEPNVGIKAILIHPGEIAETLKKDTGTSADSYPKTSTPAVANPTVFLATREQKLRA